MLGGDSAPGNEPRMTVRQLVSLACLLLPAGCAALPDITRQPQIHNPFPQLYRIAVLPFYNQSSDPHLDGIRVAEAYYQEIQQIPGFEVMPVGTVVRALESLEFEPRKGADFQKLANDLRVDAVLVGSITDFTVYYPPRMGIAVNWYAANPGFYPIPAGYGLPWGTSEEEYIPSALVHEAEFALAREQLATQTPKVIELASEDGETDPDGDSRTEPQAMENERKRIARRTSPSGIPTPKNVLRTQHTQENPLGRSPESLDSSPPAGELPKDWPDPRGFVPPGPSPTKPVAVAQSRPIITHTKLYEGHQSDFTEALANYVYFRDDARFGGWQGYLQRSDDFIRFCCYMHVTETLAARGGAGESRVVWRWPVGRYER